MAKEVDFSIAEPWGDELAMRLMNFLIAANAKQENVTVTGTVRKKEKAS